MNKLQQKLDSREVAEMVGKEHKNIIRDIRGYLEEFSQLNFEPSDFFRESTYKRRGKEYPCYLITKEGCEFIAHKLTGVKGTEFTAKYIKRFHEMENIIKEHVPQGKELYYILGLGTVITLKTGLEEDVKLEGADYLMAAGFPILLFVIFLDWIVRKIVR